MAAGLSTCYGTLIDTGDEDGKTLVIRISGRPKNNVKKKKKSLGWVMLPLAL
jgi:hypothetical protein